MAQEYALPWVPSGFGSDGVTPIAPVGDANPLPVKGNSPTVSATFTRPADANAYAALDTVADSTTTPHVITFANAARANGGNGYVTRARVQVNTLAVTPRLRLHLYRVAPTAINDNAAFTGPLAADQTKYVGYLDLGALSQEGSGADSSYAQNLVDRLQFDCAANDANLYGVLETLDAFTPGNAAVFYLELGIERN